MTIYLDVIWLLNFIFDGFLLYLTSIIVKKKIKIWRLVLSSFIGSLLVVLMVSPLSVYAMNPFVKIVFSFLMIFCLFGFTKMKVLIQQLLSFYLVTFIMGGTLIGMHYFFQYELYWNQGIFMTTNQGYGDPLTWLFVVIGFPIAYLFARKRMDQISYRKLQTDQYVEVKICINHDSIILKGLIDTGNHLKDPLSNLPVAVVQLSALQNLLPSLIQQAVIENNPALLSTGTEEEIIDWVSKVKYIPFQSVGKSHQMMIGLKPDHLFIKSDGQFVACKGVIGLTTTTLSSEKEYEVIVHPKMIVQTNQLHVS